MKRRRYLIPGLITLFLLLWLWHSFFRLPGIPIRPEAAISGNTAALFSYADGRNFLEQRGDLLADSLLANWFTTEHAQPELQIIRSALGRFRKLHTQPFRLLIGLQNAGTGNLTANAIADMRRTGFELDSLIASLRPSRQQHFRFKKYKVHRLIFSDGSELSIAQHRNLLFIARHTLLVEESLSRLASPRRSLWRARSFKPLRYHQRDEVPFAIFINPENLSVLFSNWLTPNGKQRIAEVRSTMDWLRLDPQRDSNLVRLNGKLSESHDGTIWSAAARQRPGNFAAMLQVIPESVAAFHWLHISNKNRIGQDRHRLFQKYILPWIGSEMAAVRTQTGRFWVVQMEDQQKAEAALSALSEEIAAEPASNYYAYAIQQLASERLLEVLPFNQAIADPYFTTIDNFVIFADSRSALEVWLDEYIVGKTLAQDADFLGLFQPLKDQTGQVFSYFNFINLAPDIRDWIQTKNLLVPGQPEKTGRIALLFKEAGRGWDVDGYWQPSDQPILAGETNIAWKVILDAEAVTPPMPIGNDPLRPDAIAIQDSALNLYLFRPDGKLLWKKQLDGQVLSSIHSIEYYGEGSISMLFNTPRSIYLLGMDGEMQSAFPISLQTRATNGVAVVDFNQTRDYSFFVACANGAVYGFDRMGRPLPGWNPLRDVGEVRHSLLHFQDRGRDYLVLLNESGQLMVYQRDGSYRFSPRNFGRKFPSPPDYQLSATSNRIVVTDRNGIGHVISLGGSTFSLSLLPNAREPVKFAFADVAGDERKDYLALSGNVLRASYYNAQNNFRSLYQLEFADKQDEICPVQIPGKDKSAVGVVSKALQQIQLLLPEGTVHPDFPLAGNTTFFIADLFGNGQNILVVANGDSMYAYRINV